MGSAVWEFEQARATQNLVGFEPTRITLQRRENRTKTASGGFSGGGAPRPVTVQPVTVFFGAKVQDDLPLQQNDGERVIAYYTIVAVPPLDIQENDEFSLGGITYTVVSVHRHLDYEVKADVETYYGGHH